MLLRLLQKRFFTPEEWNVYSTEALIETALQRSAMSKTGL